MLRPLRTLGKFPRMRRLVRTILGSLPRLSNVAALFVFFALWASIVGLTFWNGVMHQRCRATPEPLLFVPDREQCGLHSDGAPWCFDPHTKSVPVQLSDRADDVVLVDGPAMFHMFCEDESRIYRMALDEDAGQPHSPSSIKSCNDTVNDGGGFWMWPYMPHTDLCGYASCDPVGAFETFGPYQNAVLDAKITSNLRKMHRTDGDIPLTCGNNYNDREFGHSNVLATSGRNRSEYHVPSDVKMMSNVRMFEDPDLDWGSFNYGITNFDWLIPALLVIFQMCTLEGWVDVMYMVQDSFSDWFAAFFCIGMVLFGAFFLLNIVLAIVSEAFEANSDDMGDEKDAVDQEAEDKREIEAHHPYCTSDRIRDFTQTCAFETVVVGTIVCNTICLCMESYPGPNHILHELEECLCFFARYLRYFDDFVISQKLYKGTTTYF